MCLNDHCDYMRCEVISGAKKPSYWEQALCKQPELDELKRKCEVRISCLASRGQFIGPIKVQFVSSKKTKTKEKW